MTKQELQALYHRIDKLYDDVSTAVDDFRSILIDISKDKLIISPDIKRKATIISDEYPFDECTNVIGRFLDNLGDYITTLDEKKKTVER